MSFLIDTHVLVWWLRNDPRLPEKVKARIASGGDAVVVSSVSAFEIATKVRLGKFEEARVINQRFRELADAEGFRRLAITETHALLAGGFEIDHRDPFDRLLAA